MYVLAGLPRAEPLGGMAPNDVVQADAADADGTPTLTADTSGLFALDMRYNTSVTILARYSISRVFGEPELVCR